MPVVITGLVESTPNRLRYLLTDTAVSPPVVDTVTIPNAGGVTPDLRTDILAAMAANADGSSGSELQGVINAGVNGYPPNTTAGLLVAAGALTQAQARSIMNSDDPAGLLANLLLPRATVTIEPRAGTAQWQADVNVTAFNPDIRISVLGAVLLAVSTAICDVFIRDTPDL